MNKKRIVSMIIAICIATSSLMILAGCGEKAVKSIEITTPPTKTSYIVGEKFDPAGMVVTATYENDKTATVTEYSYDLTEELKASNKYVTITYKEQTVKQKITVSDPVKALTIKTAPLKTEYTKGEIFNPNGMVITATYTVAGEKDLIVSETNGITYSTEKLKPTDTCIEVSFGGKTVSQEISVVNGVFMEAESAKIDSENAKINTDSPLASGGEYVGDIKAGDSITFSFEASADCVADLIFVASSTYLKQDANWVPIWMGDCQLNKILQLYVNDELVTISDDVILPGGGEADGEPDQTLWFNWQEVLLKDISFKKGINDVKMVFTTHDYDDCSQSGFNNKFCPNVDYLKAVVDTNDITIDTLEVESIKITTPPTQTTFREGDKIDLSEMVVTLTYTSGTTVILDNSKLNVFLDADNQQLVVSFGEFQATHSVTVIKAPKVTVGLPELRLSEDKAKVLYVINGTFESENALSTEDQTAFKSLLKSYYFDLQANPFRTTGSWDGEWTVNTFDDVDVLLDLENKTFEICYDISALDAYSYTSHFNTASTVADYKPGVVIDEQTVVLGDKSFTILCDPTDTSGAIGWGCVTVDVKTVSAK